MDRKDMSRKEFLQSIKDSVMSDGKPVTLEMGDFERLMHIADMGARITEDACTCTIDQYGHARDPKCVLHGDW
jgi:hypothetical protein